MVGRCRDWGQFPPVSMLKIPDFKENTGAVYHPKFDTGFLSIHFINSLTPKPHFQIFRLGIRSTKTEKS